LSARARIILSSADGEANSSIAERLELGKATVGKRRARFIERRIGFKPSFSQAFAVEENPTGWWVTPYHFGIDQGLVVLMIENHAPD